MDTTSFNPGIVIKDPEPEGAIGLLEIGCRGTQLGMNMYVRSMVFSYRYLTRKNYNKKSVAGQNSLLFSAGLV